MAGKSASLEKSIGKLGVAVAGIGLAIGVESVRAAAKFQTAMELIHTQAGRSQKTVDQMSKAVLAMSAGVATGPDELAKGLYHLASTGMSTAKSLEALKIAAEGAKLGGADLESVTNALNAALVSGIKGSGDFTKAMGALNATVGSGDMRMQDLADALGTGLLTTAKNFGVTLNEVGAGLAVFGDNNIRGADAATKFQQAITYMAKPAKGADAVFKSIGMSSKELRADLGSGGLTKTLADLHDHLVKAGDTGKKMGPVLLDAFGRKPAGAINTLLGQFSRWQQKLKENQEGSKNFASSWTGYTKTFGYSWDRAKTAFQTMTIEIGQKLLPTATNAMNWIGTTGVKDLDKFGGWVSRNKTPIEDIAKVLGTIAAFRFASSKLTDLSRLLGFGSKSLGGVGGGILGSAKPIPVYVTNMGAGGLGGGGKGGAGVLTTAEQDAKNYGPAALPWLSKAKWLTRIGPSVALTGAALTDKYRPSLMTNDAKNLFAQAKTIANNNPAAMSDYRQQFGHGGSNNVSANIAKLREWVDAWKKGTSQADQNLAVLNQYLVKNTGLAKQNAAVVRGEMRKALAEIPGAMKALSTEANAAGTTIGAMLDAGITIGIRQGKDKINLVSISVIDGVKSVMSHRAQMSSPSKMTAYIGRMLAEGLALGLRSGKKGVGQATSEMMDTVRGTVIGAGSLGNVGSMSDSLGASGGGTSIGDILAFTGGQVRQDRAFARNLAVARKHGLSKSVAQQIAQLGPDQGGTLAASIAGATRGQIHQLNRDEAQIGRLGSQIAGTVSLSDTTIAKIGRAVRPHVSVTTPAQLDRHNGKKILGHG